MSQAVLETPAAEVAEDAVDAAKAGDLTELEKIDPVRVDGVGTPANGFPTLMLKGIPEDEEPPAEAGEAAAKSDSDAGDGEDGDDDDDAAEDSECSDDDDAAKAAAVVPAAEFDAGDGYAAGRAEWKAREPVYKGRGGGTEYLQVRAAWQKWQAEGTSEGLDSDIGVWQAAQAGRAEDEVAKSLTLEKKDYTAEQRRSLASQHKALPDGSYPIADASDLHNAAVLARSGHGNVAGAKRLIARRAKELGVANPLSETASKADSASDSSDGDGKACPTCKGDGKIKGGHVKCPDCDGSGKAKPAASKNTGDQDTTEHEAAMKAVRQIVDKAVAGQVITAEQAAELIAQAEKAARPLPADVKPAGPHREPDGSSTVEQLEPEAGLPTDKDPAADRVPASVAAMGKEGVPYAVRRMHDAACAAYDADSVLAEYPALKAITDAFDPAWFNHDETMAQVAKDLREMDPAAVADGRALVHKAFTDMYPSEHCSPASPPQPGSFHRPYLSAGHAAEKPSGSASVPPSEHVPDAGQFTRGYLTAGHAAPSPADHGPSRPQVATARTAYAAASKTYAEQSLKALHDHIASTFGQVCPMAIAAQAPPDLGARNVPVPARPQVPGGVNTVKAGKGKKAAKKAAKKASAEIAAQVAATLAEQGVVADADAIKSLVEAQVAPIREQYETQISELRKTVDELGAQPDPAMAPVRGQMARIPAGDAAPVEKRSLVDEAREREQAALSAERESFVAYLRKQAASPNPQLRESAFAVLDQMSDDTGKTAPAA